jgi:hypothetical protein
MDAVAVLTLLSHFGDISPPEEGWLEHNNFMVLLHLPPAVYLIEEYDRRNQIV